MEHRDKFIPLKYIGIIDTNKFTSRCVLYTTSFDVSDTKLFSSLRPRKTFIYVGSAIIIIILTFIFKSITIILRIYLRYNILRVLVQHHTV